MYLLEIIEQNDRQIVGVFDKESDIQQWIQSVPFIKQDNQGNVVVLYDEMPAYYEVEFGESIYPLTRYAFTGDDTIYVVWNEIAHINTTKGIVEGTSKVGVYIYENTEIRQAVISRETLKKELATYYDAQGTAYYFGGIGSEDGEYINVENGPFIHFDPLTIEHYNSSKSIEAFIKDITE